MSWGENDLIPVRMLNEYTYCPRLGYLMWVDGLFADSADTVHGRFVHRRVDQEPKRPRRKSEKAESADEAAPGPLRSVLLTGESCGLTAKVDLLEADGGRFTPVDYKRGKRPHTAKGAWEPERVQLCAQGLILRDNGHECTEGVLYFAGSKERVRVVFDEPLVERTLDLAASFRAVARSGVTPEPLNDSPKCPRCSLVSICLPDETHCLAVGRGEGRARPRQLYAARVDALPLYVTDPGARVGKSGEVLEVHLRGEKLAEARLGETSSVVLFGPVQISTQAVQTLCQRNIPVCYFSSGGWFYGYTQGFDAKNVDLRRHQHRVAADEAESFRLAKTLVAAKIANQRTLVRRNHVDPPRAVLSGMKQDIEDVGRAGTVEQLLGTEGVAARRYFQSFPGMLKGSNGLAKEFSFSGRNKRPPRDPVNALLSFGYSLLAREWTIAVSMVGFDPYLGFYHQPRHGKPALALDLMEEFRPLTVDSTVLTALNNGEVKPQHFFTVMGAVAMTQDGRKAFLSAWERRLAQEITHPIFGYKVSYRRLFEVQARLLARHLTGEIDGYPSFMTR